MKNYQRIALIIGNQRMNNIPVRLLCALIVLTLNLHAENEPEIHKYKLFAYPEIDSSNIVKKVISSGTKSIEINIYLPKIIKGAMFNDSANLDSIAKYVEIGGMWEREWCERIITKKPKNFLAKGIFEKIESIKIQKNTKIKFNAKLIAQGYSSPWEKFISDSVDLGENGISLGDSIKMGYDSSLIIDSKVIGINQFGVVFSAKDKQRKLNSITLSYEDINKVASSGVFRYIRNTSIDASELKLYDEWKQTKISDTCNDF